MMSELWTFSHSILLAHKGMNSRLLSVILALPRLSRETCWCLTVVLFRVILGDYMADEQLFVIIPTFWH